MMEEKKTSQRIIDIRAISKILLSRKKTFLKVWAVTIVLSAIWIFPQPRYYICDVELAPETSDLSSMGSLASMASSFGINIGNAAGGNDAIYPELYPDLFESPSFIVSLFGIKVKTLEGDVNCDYYTYLAKHQKPNVLTQPLNKLMKQLKDALSDEPPSKAGTGKGIDPFHMSKFDTEIVMMIQGNVKCTVDKKTEVISLSVQDQDPLVCATLADSVRQRLQAFITQYRTHKVRMDVEHYQQVSDSLNLEYRSAVNEYAMFCDANQDVNLQSQMSKRDELENEMQMKYNAYQAMKTQLEAMRVKLQEKTPAFTTLKSATVPVKPAGPKRMIFILGMLFLATVVTAWWLSRKLLYKAD